VTVAERWRRRLPERVTSLDPSPTGGCVFATGGGTVRALSTADGDGRWRADARRVVAVTPTTAYLADGSVLSAVDVDTGEQRWRLTAPAPFFFEGRAEGTAYLAAGPPDEAFAGTTVVGVDEATGEVRFERRFPGAANLDVSPLGLLVTTVGADRDGAVASLDPIDGHLRWDRGFDDRVTWVTRAGDGSHVVVDLSDGVAVIDAEEGRVRWSVREVNAAPAFVTGEVVYLGDRGADRLRALSAVTGRPVWTAPGGDVRRLVLDDDRLYASTWDGTVRAVSPADGAVTWTHAAADAVAHLAVLEDLVCLRDDGGTATALEAASGAERWRSRAGATTVVGRFAGALLAVDADQRVSLLAPDTGRTLRDTGATVHVVDTTTLTVGEDRTVRAFADADA
jgi:outer membrane protein assembly factor BamB